MNAQNFIPSVNFHLWEPCNMRCKFCYATFQDVKRNGLPKGHLPKEQMIQIVRKLGEFGFEKITFAGGEPTLCPWLSDLIKVAKEVGMTTMLVTNGSRLLHSNFLEENRGALDWVALSIDSLNPETNLRIGRALSGKSAFSQSEYERLVFKIKDVGYKLKINTVVCRHNSAEDLSEFIRYAKPRRWKILQILRVDGQNDKNANELMISEEEFQRFVERHSHLGSVTKIVSETNSDMKGSYVMIDPAGRFFNNTGDAYQYSHPILEIGVEQAYRQMNSDAEKFSERGGQYEW